MFSWIKKKYKEAKKKVQKLAYKKAILYWIWWSNWNIRKEKYKRSFTVAPRYNSMRNLTISWQILTKDLKWKPDGVEFLFDSMTDSDIIFKNGGDDCDGFAFLSYVFFQETGFKIIDDEYEFDHFHTYRRGLKGHVVAIYKSKTGRDVLFSNDYVCYRSRYDDWSNSDNEAEITMNSKHKLKLRKII